MYGLKDGELEMEQLKTRIYKAGKVIAQMDASEKQELYHIYHESGNTYVREIIHVLDQDHPFIYETIDEGTLVETPIYTRIGRRGEELTLYPNPTNGELNLHLNVMPNEPSELLIVDVYGRVLRSLTIPAQQNTLRLNLIDLNSGMYYLKLKNARGEFQSSFQVFK